MKILNAIGWLFKSKKRVAALVAVAFAIFSPLLGKVGIDITETQVAMVVAVLGAFILGQGLADTGKSVALLKKK